MKTPTPNKNRNGVILNKATQPTGRRRWPLAACLGLMLIILQTVVAGETHHVDIMLSAPTKNYQEVAEVIRRKLATLADAYAVRIATMDELMPPGFRRTADLVITVGIQATRNQLSAPETPPVIATLVPRISYEAVKKLPSAKEKNSTAVYLEQPISRQLELARRLLPHAHTACIVLSPQAESMKKETLSSPGLDVRYIEPAGPDAVITTLKSELRDADFAVLIYDPNIINTKTIKQALYYSYQKKLPLIAYSKAMVNAGALATVYSTNEDIGLQSVEAIKSFFKNKKLPSATYAEGQSVNCNAKVARYLGLPNGCTPALKP